MWHHRVGEGGCDGGGGADGGEGPTFHGILPVVEGSVLHVLVLRVEVLVLVVPHCEGAEPTPVKPVRIGRIWEWGGAGEGSWGVPEGEELGQGKTAAGRA